MKTLIVIATSLISTLAIASGGHFHPKKIAQCAELCTEEQIKAAAPAGIKELVNWKQAEASWESAKVEKAEKKEFTKGGKNLKAWVVTLVDEKNKDATKNKRYIYFTEDGLIFRTNLTGELK